MPTKKEYVSPTTCPLCKTGHKIFKTSRWGNFYGCTEYPKCRYIEKSHLQRKEDRIIKQGGTNGR